MLTSLRRFVGRRPDNSTQEAQKFIPLQMAVASGSPALVEFALSTGSDMNERADGKTVLHQAAAVGQLDMVMLQIQKGADINATCSEFSCTPLGLAEAGCLRKRNGGHQEWWPCSRASVQSAVGSTDTCFAQCDVH